MTEKSKKPRRKNGSGNRLWQCCACGLLCNTMKVYVLPLLVLAILISNARADVRGPDYQLLNTFPDAISVTFLTEAGNPIKTKIIKPGHEMRISGIFHFSMRYRNVVPEYNLPWILYVPLPEQGYEPMSSGRWEIVPEKSLCLNIRYLGGGVISRMPNFSRQPILFPLRPRNRSETFDQYRLSQKDVLRSSIKHP